MEQVMQDRFIQPVYLLRVFLYILHAEDDMPDHAAWRREPCAWTFLEFVQLADIVQERTRENEMCIARINFSETWSDGGNIYRRFKQPTIDGSVVSHGSGPAAKAGDHFGCKTTAQ